MMSPVNQPLQLNSSNSTIPVSQNYPAGSEAKAKYSLSVLSSPAPSPLIQNVKVNIDLRGGSNPPSAQITQNSIKQKMTMAERIKEVKESQAMGILLPVSKTRQTTILGTRSKSIDPHSTRLALMSGTNTSNNSPLNLGSMPASMRTSRHGSLGGNQVDLVKRFKNISEREVQPGYISNKVYFAAQNTSQYNNVYSFVGRSANDSPPLIPNGNTIKYQKRKLSYIERPT